MTRPRTAFFVLVLLLVSSELGFAPESAAVPLFEGLGSFARKVKTASPDAQRYFDQGLAFMYGFNHDEAIRSFRRAGEESVSGTARGPCGRGRTRIRKRRLFAALLPGSLSKMRKYYGEALIAGGACQNPAACHIPGQGKIPWRCGF